MLKIFAVNKLKTASLIVYFRVGLPVQDMLSKSNLAAIFSVYLAFMQESCLIFKLNQHHQPSTSTQNLACTPAALKHGIRKRKRKRNTESNINDRKLKNFTVHNLVQSKENLF